MSQESKNFRTLGDVDAEPLPPVTASSEQVAILEGGDGAYRLSVEFGGSIVLAAGVRISPDELRKLPIAQELLRRCVEDLAEQLDGIGVKLF